MACILKAFDDLLGIIRERVELVASVREFFDKGPVIALIEVEKVGASDPVTGVSVPHLKESDEFRVFVAALRANQSQTGVLGGTDSVGAHRTPHC
jgi:hypothetical protein